MQTIIDNLTAELLKDSSLPSIEDLDLQSFEVVDTTKLFLAGKLLTAIGDEMVNKAKEHLEDVDFDETTKTFWGHKITKVIIPTYIYPTTSRLKTLMNKEKSLKKQTKELTQSIKTVQKQMLEDGEAIEGKPNIIFKALLK